MPKSAQEKGKEFEEDFRLWLKHLTEKHGAMYHRFYDTRSAGAYLPDQPGDYLLIWRGAPHLWELKSSGAHNSLAAGLGTLMSKEQATFHKLWQRAGATTHVLFWQQVTGEVELWHGGHVATVRHEKGRRLARQDCLRYGNIGQFKAQFLSGLSTDKNYGAKYP